MRITFSIVIVVAGCLAIQNTTQASVELITNGGFESGTLAGWTTFDQAGSWVPGNFSISVPGTPTPHSGFATSAVGAGGSFYAVSDQGGPGAHALLQSFSVPAGTTSLSLSFSMFVNDGDGGPIVDPAGLDFTAGANQHARVDVLTAAAAALSTSAADVVANFYLGVDPQATNPNPFTAYAFDLLAAGLVPGSTYQLRFAEVDNQFFFNQGVDNVSILAGVIPEAGSFAIFAGLFGYTGVTRRRKSA